MNPSEMTPRQRIEELVKRMERDHLDIYNALQQILSQHHDGRVSVDPQLPVPDRGIVFEFDEHNLATVIRFKRPDEP